MTDVTFRIGETLKKMPEPLSGAELARRTGIPESTMRAYINGLRKPPLDVCLRIGEILGVDGYWLFAGSAPAAKPAGKPKAGFIPPPQFFGPRDMLVYASVEGGRGEMVITNDPIDIVARPWYLGEARDGFAVVVVGDSMSPAYEPGDLAVVNPHLPAIRGKNAIFATEADDGTYDAIIKRLVSYNDTEWTVEQHNPPKRFTLSRATWKRALRVVGRMET